MREIKFRYRIRYVDGVIRYHYFTLQDIEEHSGLKKVNLERAGMKILSRDLYTGFKDKNEKEIYEKDIVKISGFGNGHDGVYEVFWAENYLHFDLKGRTNFGEKIENMRFDAMPEVYFWDEVKVIGNRDENPELLEK